MASLAADTRRLFLSPGHALKALGWAAVGHSNIALGVWVLALSLDIDVTWIDCLVLIPLVLLITTVPISLGGIGVREGTFVVLLAPLGISGGHNPERARCR